MKNFAIIINFEEKQRILAKTKKENPFEFSLLWCHQGLMYPCKHLYLNALPLAYIKKPRDWHV